MLPARGPRPTLKGETVLSLRLMDDVQIPQVAKTFGPNWHFFSRDQSQNYQPSVYDNKPQLMYRNVSADGSVSTQMADGPGSSLLRQRRHANRSRGSERGARHARLRSE